MTTAADGAVLHRTDHDYRVRLKNGLTYHFGLKPDPSCTPVTRISQVGCMQKNVLAA